MSHEHSRIIGDITSISVVVATMASWLPPIAAMLSIVWLSMQIFDWTMNKIKRAKGR